MDELDTWLERVYAADGDRETLDRLYDGWAEQYDKHLWGSGNPYIAIAAGMLGRHVPDWSAAVLDAGCGTGNMGQVLHQMGYSNLTGLDASEGMLQVATRKAVYSVLHHLVLGAEIALPGESFDAVVVAGVLTHGHAPPESLDGIVKLVRPGGPIVFSLSQLAYDEHGFGEKIVELEKNGVWELLDASRLYQSFPFSSAEGHLRHRVSAYRRL